MKTISHICIAILLSFVCSLGLMSFTGVESPVQPDKHYREIRHYTRNFSYGTNSLQGVILHHTATRSCSAALAKLCCDTSKVSAHVLIDRNGTRYILAKPRTITWHAGKSYAFRRENANKFTLGIEFQGNTCNGGRLTDDQIASGIEYLLPIMKQYGISIDHILTHKMVRDAYLKRHPGAVHDDGTPVEHKPDISNSEYTRFITSLKARISEEKAEKLRIEEEQRLEEEQKSREDSLIRIDSLLAQVKDADQQSPQFHTFIPSSKVQLTSGEYKDRENWDTSFLMSLDTERFLYRFRKNAGLSNPDTIKPYGGWEAGEVGGHSLGHYLTAMSCLYAHSHDTEVKRRINHVVSVLFECQQHRGTGFIAEYDESLLDKHEKTGDGWAPYYTMHKVMQGLIDAYRLTNIKLALVVASQLADYVHARIQKITDLSHWHHIQDIIEVGGIAESLISLYEFTGRKEYLQTAQFFHQMDKLEPASEGRDVLDAPDLKGDDRNKYANRYHANTTIPQFISALADYRVTKDEKMLKAAENFWSYVVEHRTYCNGTTSYHEHWNRPEDQMTGELGYTAGETCCTYNLIKLSNALFDIHQDARYADYVELALINDIMGSIEPKTSNFMYFHTQQQGSFKTYGPNTECFWCCTGTGMENHQRYGESIYFRDADTITVNQFIASSLSLDSTIIEQSTGFPLEGRSVITIKGNSASFCLKIRIPKWCDDFEVKLNGKQIKNLETRGSYAYIARTWNDGDRIEVLLPMHLYTEVQKDNPDIAVIKYGPMVLAADLGTEGVTPELVTTTDNLFGKIPDSYKVNISIPSITGSISSPAKWLKAGKQSLSFHTTKTDIGETLRFLPLYQMYARRFADYLHFRR